MAAEKPLVRLLQLALISIVVSFFVLTAYLSKQDVQKADATGQYAPAGGSVVVGTNLPVTDTDHASYRAAFASDNRYWTIENAPSGGIDIRMNFDGILINEANKISLLHEDSTSSSAVAYRIQLWDYVNETWRNVDKSPHTSLTDVSMNHEIFNGYFLDDSGDPINTPLTNFVSPDSNRRIQLRIYSTYDATTQVIRIDRVQVQAVTETQMYAADSSVDAGGTPTNTYWNTFTTDAVVYGVPALTAGVVRLNHTFQFKHYVSYPGANAILVNYTGSSTNAALGIRLRIYNFTTALWENLNSNLLTDTAITNHQFAKSNINLNDYMRNGEIRINFYNNTYVGGIVYGHEVDHIDVTIGSVTTPSATAEVSFGSEATGSSFLNSRDIDTSLVSPNTWQIDPATTSNVMYGLDYAGTFGVNTSVAANINFPVTIPRDAALTGVRFAGRYKSGVGTRDVRMGIRDVSTNNSAGTGGWSLVGTANSSAATYTFSDGVLESNQTDYVSVGRGLVNLRLRTIVSTTTSTAAADWDFAFVSIRWTEGHEHPSLENKYTPVDGTLASGDEDTIDGATNVGSWKGLISTDNRYWVVKNDSGGAEIRMKFNNVINNRNNKLVLTREFRVSSADMNPIFEIYDYPNAEWRTIEPYDPTNNNVADATEVHDIYNGYFGSDPQNPIDTPLSNFISDDLNRQTLIRIRATYDIEPRKMYIDRVQLMAVSDSEMSPSKHTIVDGAYVSGIYTGVNLSDNIRFTLSSDVVSGLEDYFTFGNIQFMPASNALVVQYEGRVSDNSLNYLVRAFNFETASWVNLNSVALNDTTETAHAFALASIDPADFVSSGGEARIGFKHSGAVPATARNLIVDHLKLTFGSVPVSTSSSEVSFGSETVGSSYLNARDMDTSAAAPNTWQIDTATTATKPYSFDYAGTYGTNYSAAANLNFWVEVPHGSGYISNRLIARYRSNETDRSIQPALRDYFGLTAANAGGFLNVGTVNNSTSYTLSDIVNDNNSEDYYDFPHHTVNANFRTVGTNTALSSVTEDIDFAMASARWIHSSGDPDGPAASRDGLIINTDKFGYVDPGDVYTYRHQLLNNTLQDRSFIVQAVSSHGWTVQASPDSGLILAGAKASLDIIVTAPLTAEIGTIDVATITVDSPELPVQQDISFDSTSVNRDDFPHGVGDAGSGDTDSCLICHDLHESDGEYKLLRENSFKNMCSNCHNLYLGDDLYTGTGIGNYDPGYPGHAGGKAYNKPCSNCPVGSASNASVYEVPEDDALTHDGHRMSLADVTGAITYADGVITTNKNYIPGGSKQVNRLISYLGGVFTREPATSTANPLPPESQSNPTGTTGGLFCTSCHGPHGLTGKVLPTSVFANGTLVGPPGRNKFLSAFPNFDTMGYGTATPDILDWKVSGGKWCVYCHDLLKPGTATANVAHRCHGYDKCLTCHGPADGSGLQDFPHAGSENLLSEPSPSLCARCHTINPPPCP